MRLTSVEIRDYRSIFVDDAGQPFRLELGEGANALVGQNNCGKSNVLRAISLALDPHHELCAEEDTPGPRPFSHPIITLGFVGDPGLPGDADVLAAASAYERAIGIPDDERRADRGEVSLRVAFHPHTRGDRSGRRARDRHTDDGQRGAARGAPERRHRCTAGVGALRAH